MIGQVAAIIDFLKNEQNDFNIVVPMIENEKEQQMKYRGITIHKRPKCNTWYTRFTKNGKIIYVKGKTQKECYNNLKKAYNSSEDLSPKKVITLKNWFNQWLELYKIGKIKESTIKDYKSIIKNISDSLFNKDITAITLEDLITTIDNVKAQRVKQKVYELLMAMFTKAKNHEIIDKNFMERIDKPKHTKVNSQALTRKQEEEFVKVCKTIKYGDYFLIALYQGLRHGEAMAITFDDIDLTNKKLTINKSINHYDKVDTTKNEQSIRNIPLFDKSIEILKNYNGQAKQRVFTMTQNELDTIKSNLQNKLSFKFKIKDLRTTFITRCQEKGIPEYVIQSWVGHKIGSIVTKSVYTKFNEEDNIKYINIFNKDENQT